ncbi:hypothetical protein DFH05DRAFT_789898 [Lentinula detonsa]|uniref:Uncharacterized protein n=1 Tax=Lentinula detonsa TaxID=2804962 RepID=A0A9W8P569_9AGAR|nr:hypothetical protein DFH05DRAFT_789898 [Lentinula detonsa]
MTDANNGDEAIPIPIRTSMASSGSASRRSSTETRTTRTGHSSSSTRTKDRHKTSPSSRELALLLAVERNKSETLKLSLDEAQRELAVQRRRIEEAETNLLEVTSAFMKANKERLEALHNAAVVAEERELYRLQLLAAQNDIDKAQNIVKTIDERRVQAEKDAAKYRRSARELREEQLIMAAREEGRRLGFREGLQRARAEVGFLDIGQDGYVTPPSRTPLESVSDGDEDRSTFYSDELGEDPVPLPHPMPSEPPSVRDGSPQPQFQPQLPPNPPPHETPIPVAPPRPPSSATNQIHPIPIHNMPVSPRHHRITIPPDGMIPLNDGSGNGIMLPPPHELSPMPPIMELSPAPPPPQIIEEEPRIVPPPGSHRTSMYASHPEYQPGRSYRGQSSPESSSTAMSQFDMLAEPQSMMANLSPMSAIPEVASGFTSPNPPSMHGGDLHRSGSMRSITSARRSPSPIPVPHGMQTPRTQQANLQDVDVNYYSANPTHQKVDRKQSMSSMTSSKRAKSPPSNRHRPYSPPQLGNIYTNPHYQTSNETEEYRSQNNSGRRSQTPTQRSRTPFIQEEQPRFVPPTPPHIPHASSQEPLRKPSRRSSLTSAGSISRTTGTRQQSSSPPVVTPPTAGIYTTLAPPELQVQTHSPQSSSSGDYSVAILSPTPPGSANNDNEEGGRRAPLNEFLSAKDAERPIPMPVSPRAQSPSPRLHPMSLAQSDDPSPLPTAPFGASNMGTPIALGGGGIFIPSGFTPRQTPGPGLSSPNASSTLPESGSDAQYSYNSLGMPTNSPHRPVIPDPSLLGPADSDTDSEDRVSSGMNSEANTLTTPPTVARGLPSKRGAGSRGKATSKKKRR